MYMMRTSLRPTWESPPQELLMVKRTDWAAIPSIGMIVLGVYVSNPGAWASSTSPRVVQSVPSTEYSTVTFLLPSPSHVSNSKLWFHTLHLVQLVDLVEFKLKLDRLIGRPVGRPHVQRAGGVLVQFVQAGLVDHILRPLIGQ